MKGKAFTLLTLVLCFGEMGFSQWIKVQSPDAHPFYVGSSRDNLFVSALSGIYSTSNVGDTWFRDSVLSDTYIFSIQSYGDSLYAIGGGLFFSTDNGNNWNEIDSSLPGLNCLLKSNDTLFVGWGYGWQWGERGGIFLSTDNGTSWNGMGIEKDTAIFALARIGNNMFAGGVLGNMVSAGVHGVFRSTNMGVNWTAVNNGLPLDGEVSSFAVIEDNLFVCIGDHIYGTTNNGESWSSAYSANTGVSIQLLAHKNHLYVGTIYGVYASIDMGTSWISINDGLYGDALDVLSLAVHRDNLFIATFDGLWKHQLLKETFQRIDDRVHSRWNLLAVPLQCADSRRTVLFPAASSVAYAYHESYVPEETLKNGVGYWIAFDTAQTISVLGDLITTDSIDVIEGWNLIGGISFPTPTVNIVADQPGTIMSNFFGYQSGYYTTDTLMPMKGYWVKSNRNGKLIFTSSRSVALSNRIIIAQTPDLPPAAPDVVGQGRDLVPKKYYLYQNYPNPFNPLTEIRYAIRDAGLVTLKIYDVLGREVVTLVNKVNTPDEYVVQWDAARQPSGVYFYRLSAGEYTETKKLLLIR